MQLIYLINAVHLDGLRSKGFDDPALLSSVSLIEESWGRQRVRMGTLAFVGAHRVNGVSALHSDLMKETVFRDLHAIFPDRINNKTNGITFRRWLFEANPGLTKALVGKLGPKLLDDPEALLGLEPLAGDTAFQADLRAIRRRNKEALGKIIQQRLGFPVDPDALFDVQIKRIHEYKRQHLNLLETVALYNAIRADPSRNWVPRVKIFAGKAAASYHTAKLIIKLANDIARVVNSDPTVPGSPQGGVPAELQREPRGIDHPRRRPVRADLDRRHGSLGHRQHEAGAQRRPDDRHARRRQCRDQRPGRRG